jgi:cell division protein FtsW (lipid II flippase)
VILARTARGGVPRRRGELGLLFVAGIAVLLADLLLSLALTNRLPGHVLWFIGILAAFGLAVQVVNRRLVPDADPVLVPVALFLNGLGYVFLTEITYRNPGNPTYFDDPRGQLLWSVVGLVVYVATLLVVRRSRDLERYRYLTLVAAFVLLVAPMVPGIGLSVGGARLWVHLHSFEFQPVEIAKLLLVLFFASYFVEKRELLTIRTRRVGNHLLPDLRAYGPIAVAGVMSLLIILVEHDIGFSLILFCAFLTMIWVTTGRWTYVLIGLVVFAIVTFLASHVLVQVNQRIEVWLDPWKYYDNGSGIGLQPVQGELALGRGGWFGTGLGLGTAAQVVPIANSDFIFSVIGEELGLVGTTAVAVAFLLMVMSGLRAAARARSEFAKLVGVGLAAILGFQGFFIMAGVARLLPLTGVTLPFVSYGGSSLVANYVLVALLMRISNEANQIPDASGSSRRVATSIAPSSSSSSPVSPAGGAPATSSTRTAATTGTNNR